MKRKLPENARCGLCNHWFIMDAFGYCGRLNHLHNGCYQSRDENEVCGNFSLNVWAEIKSERENGKVQSQN